MLKNDSTLETDPFFAPGGPIGCLLLHGFSGNPAELRPLADVLAARGYGISVPLLPGHGPTPEGTGPATARDWIRAVAEAHDTLAATCECVVLVGYSMGGLLSMVETTRREPAGLVLLGVPTSIGDWRTRLLPLAKYVVRWWYPLAQADFADPELRELMRGKSSAIDLDDPLVQQQIRRSVRIPTNAIDHFFRLMRRVRPLIRTITVPTLIVHGRQDSTALPVCAEEIYRGLASTNKKLAWFASAGHQLVTGTEGDAVVQCVARWIAEVVGEATFVPYE